MADAAKAKKKKQSRKPEQKRIQTGSIAFRIALGSGFSLLVVLVLLDLLLLIMDAVPYLDLSGDFPALADSLRNYFLQASLFERYMPLFQAESLLILFRICIDMLRIRKQLAPLDELATIARKFSQLDESNEERFQKLESAIEQISPDAEEGSLSTGDKELEGLEEALNNLIRRMRESYRQQARFVSDASHELRTPIAVIRGYADMLDRWGKQDETILNESIEAIRTESENMQHLIEQLLFLARGDSGRTPIRKTDFDLSEMIREVCDESAMIDPSHEYRFLDGGSIQVCGDLSLLKQAARILIENASKYSPAGSEIVLQTFSGDGKTGFSVQDSGIGISQEALPHVFDRFYRADDSRSKQTGGTGLGLAIAKWIVDRHNGHFELVSRTGVGTRISIILDPAPKA